eukprot:1189648-Prorocentrum_minimum.AAC.2
MLELEMDRLFLEGHQWMTLSFSPPLAKFDRVALTIHPDQATRTFSKLVRQVKSFRVCSDVGCRNGLRVCTCTMVRVYICPSLKYRGRYRGVGYLIV